MIRIAVVDDQKEDADCLGRSIGRYMQENHATADIKFFDNPVIFLTNYKPVFDLIFLDIQMPHIDGMETARKLRKIDPGVFIIFVTNMAQFAVNGYEVDALDFIVKPINYFCFAAALQKATRLLRSNAETVMIRMNENMIKIPVRSIYYIEVNKHKLAYYTEAGNYEAWGTMKEQEALLPKEEFLRCNRYCLVNIRHVNEVDQESLIVNETKLFISRAKKKTVISSLLRFYGKNT